MDHSSLPASQLNASEFAYGTRYIDRPGAVEIDPVREWKVHFEAFGVPPHSIAQAEQAIRHIKDISSPQLRARLT